MRSGKRLRSHVLSGTCIARTAVGDLRVSVRTRTAAGSWLQVRVSSVALACCPGAGAYRNAPPAPDGAKRGRIDAACGAAGSCTRLAAGCAQAPRRCRVMSAARRSARSSAAFRAAHSALGVDQMSRLAAHSYGNLCARPARTHSPVSAGGAVRPRRSSGAAGGWTTAHTAGLGLAAHDAPCASAQVRTVDAAA
jgi:hypothetical protein